MLEKRTPHHLLWADSVRIIAIAFVVLVHAFELSSSYTIDSFATLLIFLTAKTCVPLFLMLSGALLLAKQESSKDFFHKRLRRILAPWLTWAFILFVLTYPLLPLQPLSAIREYIKIFVSGFTFLPMIVCLYLLVPTFRIITHAGGKTHTWYLIGVWFLGTSLLPFVRNTQAFPLFIDNGLVRQTIQFSGYVLAGWVLSQVQIKRKSMIWILLAIILAILSSAYLVLRSGELNEVFTSYSAPLVVLSSMGFFVLAVNSERILVSRASKYRSHLSAVSRACYGVFLSHVLVLQWVTTHIISSGDSSLQTNLLRWAVVLFLSFSMILLLAEMKGVRNLIT